MWSKTSAERTRHADATRALQEYNAKVHALEETIASKKTALNKLEHETEHSALLYGQIDVLTERIASEEGMLSVARELHAKADDESKPGLQQDIDRAQGSISEFRATLAHHQNDVNVSVPDPSTHTLAHLASLVTANNAEIARIDALLQTDLPEADRVAATKQKTDLATHAIVLTAAQDTIANKISATKADLAKAEHDLSATKSEATHKHLVDALTAAKDALIASLEVSIKSQPLKPPTVSTAAGSSRPPSAITQPVPSSSSSTSLLRPPSGLAPPASELKSPSVVRFADPPAEDVKSASGHHVDLKSRSQVHVHDDHLKEAEVPAKPRVSLSALSKDALSTTPILPGPFEVYLTVCVPSLLWLLLY